VSEETRGYTIKIPQDVSRPDKIMFGATARQCVILGGAAAWLWLAWLLMRSFTPPLLFAAPAALFLLLLGIAVSTERDGLTYDRLLVAAIRQSLSPRRRAMAPEGISAPPEFLTGALRSQRGALPTPLDLPVQQVGEGGVVDLGGNGVVVLAECSTVHFTLRTSTEQELLIGGFARWLNSLTGPAQIISRTTTANLDGQISALRTAAPGLPHPLLETAAGNHADFLARIGQSGSVLHRTALVAARETDPQHLPRAIRRIGDAAALLTACEVDARPLDQRTAYTVLSAALDPDTNRHRNLTGA
jgi:hypothetical protein